MKSLRLISRLTFFLADTGKVTIGKAVMMGPNVQVCLSHLWMWGKFKAKTQLYAGGHSLDPVERRDMTTDANPITVSRSFFFYISGNAVLMFWENRNKNLVKIPWYRLVMR